jgi:hypothetical protein
MKPKRFMISLFAVRLNSYIRKITDVAPDQPSVLADSFKK